MKSLVTYLNEELGLATPASTIGIGNPQVPGLSSSPGDVEGSMSGSGDLLDGRRNSAAKCRKEKKEKSITKKIK